MLFFNFFKKIDLVVLRLFNLHDRRLLHRDTAVLVASEFHDHVLIGDVDDNAVETAGGYYAVAYSQLCQHGIQLFLLFLLGSDGKEVHDHYDYNDVNQSEADADTACCCGVT